MRPGLFAGRCTVRGTSLKLERAYSAMATSTPRPSSMAMIATAVDERGLAGSDPAFIALAFGTTLPLFFLSGAFGPISFNVPILQVIAQIFPVYYAIVLQQHAFHSFYLNTLSIWGNVLILAAYALGLIILASVVLRRSTVAN